MYAVIDIGSNTIVLAIYEVKDEEIKVIDTYSYPAHLIDYVEDKVMRKEGIQIAKSVLIDYIMMCRDKGIEEIYCDITEPCRIKNKDELVKALKETNIPISPLSGEEEATLDFNGAKLSFPNISEGLAFDVGGGSTELISFKDNKALNAISLPLGCVRLSHYPLDTTICATSLQEVIASTTSLQIEVEKIIGIGGTVRAISKLHKDLYGSKDVINTDNLNELFYRLINEDEEAIKYLKKNVDEARQKVLLPGMHMVLEIAKAFKAKEILVSKTGLREGFLLHSTNN